MPDRRAASSGVEPLSTTTTSAASAWARALSMEGKRDSPVM